MWNKGSKFLLLIFVFLPLLLQNPKANQTSIDVDQFNPYTSDQTTALNNLQSLILDVNDGFETLPNTSSISAKTQKRYKTANKKIRRAKTHLDAINFSPNTYLPSSLSKLIDYTNHSCLLI